jgi:plastocyanin
MTHLPLAAANDITAFHVVGVMLALWALLVSGLGVVREDFPGKGNGQKVVMAISALLVAGAIGTAIGTAKSGPKNHEAAAVTRTGPEGAAPPPQGGTPAPGTGSSAGQQPGGATGNAKPAKPQGPVQTLLLSADPTGQLRFDKSSLQAKAGSVRITMNNPSPVPHNISLQGPGGVNQQGQTVPHGGSSQVAATLKAGTYTYYCSVPGHRQAGMQGTLTVK